MEAKLTSETFPWTFQNYRPEYPPKFIQLPLWLSASTNLCLGAKIVWAALYSFIQVNRCCQQENKVTLSTSELASLVGMQQPNVTNYLKQLEKENVLTIIKNRPNTPNTYQPVQNQKKIYEIQNLLKLPNRRIKLELASRFGIKPSQEGKKEIIYFCTIFEWVVLHVFDEFRNNAFMRGKSPQEVLPVWKISKWLNLPKAQIENILPNVHRVWKIEEMYPRKPISAIVEEVFEYSRGA
jgi:hypothetical protein